MITPYFSPIDLSKAEKHEHPDIRTDGTNYLALISDRYYLGPFHRVWYGLTFPNWGGASGLQFDAPGYNHSRWQAVWEMHTEPMEDQRHG